MRKSIFATVIVFGILAFAGCSTVKICSDPALTVKTGLKYYTAKPYILVERSSADNSIVKATLHYMPDLANPQYMYFRPGLGSAKVNLKTTDGYLDSFGIDSDTEIPELLKSLGSVISDAAGAAKSVAAVAGPESAGVTSTTIEFYEVIMTSEGTRLRKIEF